MRDLREWNSVHIEPDWPYAENFVAGLHLQ